MDPPSDQPPPSADLQPDAPDKDAMAKIRQRRLAKLGSQAPRSKPVEGSSSTTDSTETIASASTATSFNPPTSTTDTMARTPTPTPTLTPALTPALGSASPGRITVDRDTQQPASAAKPVAKKLGADADAESAPAKGAAPEHQPQQVRKRLAQVDVSIAIWTDRALAQIFRITVDPTQTIDANGHALTLLPDLSQDMKDAGEPLKLSSARLDQALLEAASLFPLSRSLFHHLYHCWKRALRMSEGLKSDAAEKKQVIDEAKRLGIANCLFALAMPELFERDSNMQNDQLVPLLLGDVDKDSDENRARRDLADFLSEATRRFGEASEYPAAFTNAISTISDKLLGMSLDSDYKRYMDAILLYSRFPALLDAVSEHPRFNVSLPAHQIEQGTILGPFFALSPLHPSAVSHAFPGPRGMDPHLIRISQESIRMQSRAHQADLYTIVKAFIRASIPSRNRTLDWFAQCLNQNHKRRAMQVKSEEVATDGFMMNITVILDRLCEPFMDTTFSKIDRIEADYLRRQPRVDVSDETKLNADNTQSEGFYSARLPGTSNFISEVFFLALAAHHYGSEAANSKLKDLERDIKYMDKRLKQMEAERANIADNPAQLRLFETSVQRTQTVLERTMGLKFAIEGVLLDDQLQALSLRFMRYVSVWLLRVASKSDYKPGKEISLPLPNPPPMEFSCLPEYALQNIVDNFMFIFRYVPQILTEAVGDEMISLCIVFLEASEHIKNPYLKSSLVSLLYWGTMQFQHLSKGVFGNQLISMPFANAYLLHALIKFYIECESTGAHTQFFDKFNIRYEIFQVIKCVWINDVYKERLEKESKSNTSFFTRFVNLLLNDATFVLDEALGKFPRIHALEEALRAPGLSEEDKTKTEEELQTLQGQATSYMQLANETLTMMVMFTKALASAFTTPEIVSRLASMLNYNLATLAGPKNSRLNVDQKEKYQFRPIMLLADFVAIYTNLGKSEAFISAVAADGRSYRAETLERAGSILMAKTKGTRLDVNQWTRLCKRFQKAKEAADQAEMDLGDVPAEFEDPIMGDLMRDPVILPSRQVVDRSTIMQHLLSDPIDPFTRQPMTVEDVIPEDELRGRIESWVEEKRKAARERVAAQMTEDEKKNATGKEDGGGVGGESVGGEGEAEPMDVDGQ